jgi:RHH-type rel operon transcriptional repressor/antitoxin RelB
VIERAGGRSPSEARHAEGGCKSRTLYVPYWYSEVVMLAIRLPQSIEKRLEKLARRTGRTKSFYVRQAILEHLEDLEDLDLAEGALERIHRGEEQTLLLKDFMKRHGLGS